MRRFIQGISIMIISGFYLFISSCTSETCFEVTESYIKANFYRYSTKKLTPPDSITAYGINMEASKIYDKNKKIQPAMLPLNASTDSSVIIIKINTDTDTIKFWYSSYPHLVSKECGYTYYHDIDSIFSTKHSIDSISEKNRSITTANGENIGIYY